MTKAYFGNRSLDSVNIKCSFYCPHWKKLLTSADNENSTEESPNDAISCRLKGRC